MKTRMILFALGAAVMLPACSSVPVVDTGKRGIFQQAGPGDNMTSPRSLPIALTPATSERSESGFVWPVREGRISSFFGKRRRDFHEGVDIRSSRGAPVYAAQDGQVIYSSRRIGGYGNMVVVRHAGDMATVYAHNKKNLVKVGDHVTQGAVIALVGATGKATGPHLHFEIRKGELPQDPLLYLPEIRSPAVAKK